MALLDPTALFFLAATLLQMGLGFLIVVRRPGVEWAFVLGALFVFNGFLSLQAFLVTGGLLPVEPTDGIGTTLASHIRYYFDRATTILILYVALSYPRRPAFLSGRRWVLPVLFTGGILLVWSFVLFKVPFSFPWPSGAALPAGCTSGCRYNTLGYHIAYDLASIGFIVLLVRWAIQFPRTQSPIELQQFKLLFAAFAMRAVNVGLTYGTDPLFDLFRNGFPTLAYDPLAPLGFAVPIAGVLAIPTAVFFLLRARSKAATQTRKAIDFVLLFFILGAAEYVLLQSQSFFGTDHFQLGLALSPLTNLDYQVIRPALVLYAMIRYNLLGTHRRDATLATFFVGAVVGLSFTQGIYLTLENAIGDALLRVVLALAGGLAVAIPAARLARPYFLPRPTNAAGSAIETYVASLEDAYRNQAPGPATMASFEQLRAELGISVEQAEALQEAVRTRWATRAERDWLPGDRIRGRYEIERLLGEGGSAEAFLARDVLDGSKAVLKRTRHLDAPSRRILLEESYALAKMAHPSIVKLLRVETVGEEPVLVLEHLEGGSLATRLAKGRRMPAKDALRIARQVLAGLGAAHAQGLIHRDVKPSNILFDGAGNAKLSDFGLAKAMPSHHSLGAPTATGPAQAGTLRYMSPEQVRGLPATERSDLYGVGLVLAECLTGSHPVPASLSDFAMRKWIVEGPAPKLSGLPVGVRAVVEKALARNPEMRFASPIAFAAALPASVVAE